MFPGPAGLFPRLPAAQDVTDIEQGLPTAEDTWHRFQLQRCHAVISRETHLRRVAIRRASSRRVAALRGLRVRPPSKMRPASRSPATSTDKSAPYSTALPPWSRRPAARLATSSASPVTSRTPAMDHA